MLPSCPDTLRSHRWQRWNVRSLPTCLVCQREHNTRRTVQENSDKSKHTGVALLNSRHCLNVPEKAAKHPTLELCLSSVRCTDRCAPSNPDCNTALQLCSWSLADHSLEASNCGFSRLRTAVLKLLVHDMLLRFHKPESP